MPLTCDVSGCRQYRRELKLPSKTISIHGFPDEAKEIEKWLKLVDVNTKEISKRTRICGLHFSENCFIRTPYKNRRDASRLIPGSLPLEFKANGQQLINIDSASIPKHSSAIPMLVIEEETIENENNHEEDEIQSFDELLSSLENPLRSPESFENHWKMFLQPDGICFYRLSRDELFNEVFMSFKILVNKEMKVKVLNRYDETNDEELQWTLKDSKLELWSQLYTILDYYQAEPEIKKSSDPKKIIKQDLQSSRKIRNIEDFDEIPIEENIRTSFTETREEESFDISEEMPTNDEPIQDVSKARKTSKPKKTSKAGLKPLCFRCDERFRTYKKLIKHLNESHDGPFTCDKCGKGIAMKSKMERHQRSHLNDENQSLVCHICGFKFKRKACLQLHQIRHQGAIRVPCSHCGLMMLPECLNRHIKVRHEGYKPHKCSICLRSFAGSFNLKEHERIHMKADGTHIKGKFNKEGIFIFECPKCSKNFKKGGQIFEKHVRDCSGTSFYRISKGYSYKCTECPKKFGSRPRTAEHMALIHNIIVANVDKYCFECKIEVDDLRKHTRTHSCQFRCHFCTLSFLSQESFNRHLKRIHEKGDHRPFICDLCGAKFKTKNHVKTHSILVHTSDKDKNFVCQLCPRRYAFRYVLNSHMQSAHSNLKKYHCSYCDMRFKKINLLREHCRVHHKGDLPYPCRRCSEKLRTLNDLKHHLEDEHGESMNVQKYHDVV